MQILLVTMYYYPEPHSIPHDLATELVNRGHNVDVITGFPNYPSGEIYVGYKMSLYQRESLDGVNVIRLPFYVNRSKSVLPRILSYLSFTAVVALFWWWIVKRPQVIWTYQIGLPGVVLSRLKRVPLVHEVQDLWPEWGRSGIAGMRTWLFKLLDQQERFIYRSAHVIVTISHGLRRVLMSKHVPEAKITVIPNWANEQNFRPLPRDPALGVREQFGDTFSVMYVGNIGIAQALDVVLKAAELLRDLPNLRFIMIGDGVERERLSRETADRDLSSIRFIGSRSQDQAAAYLAWADVVLIHLKDEPAYAITIPSKTYAYLACGRPILAAASGDTAELIESLNAGVVCPPENSAALADAIRWLYALSDEAREALGKNGSKAFETHFTRQVLVDQYEKVFYAVNKPAAN